MYIFTEKLVSRIWSYASLLEKGWNLSYTSGGHGAVDYKAGLIACEG